ncbi:MAG: hypothetical protein PVF15_07680 [Candidatus Bathyarchaeota archaeon]|jgi:hypothetical protein
MQSVGEIFSRLIFEIRSFEKHQKLLTKRELQSAIKWLKNHQHPEGYWGYESVADTGLVLLAFSIYGIKERKWRIKRKYYGGLELGISWLKRVRNVDNWENNLWDTSICIQALLRLGVRDEWVFKVVEWVKNQVKEKHGDLELHHIAQAINALLDAGLKEEGQRISHLFASKVADRLPEKERNGSAILDPYVAGQVLDSLVRAQYNISSNVLLTTQKCLRSFLERIKRTGISEATFQDVTMGFMGLASFLGGEVDQLIDEILVEIFRKPERFKEDGSWYHDAKKTAFALIGLSRITYVRRIEEFPQRIYSTIMKFQKETEEAFENVVLKNKERVSRIREGYIWLSISFGAILALLPVILGYGGQGRISEIITAILLIILPMALGRLYLCIRTKEETKLAS